MHVLVEVHALRLAIGALGGQKFLKGIVPQAVDAGDKPLAGDRVPGLFLLADVAHHPFHGPRREAAARLAREARRPVENKNRRSL